MRVKLLNDGGYYGLELVEFPVEVEAQEHRDKDRKDEGAVQVTTEELVKIGADPECFDDPWTWTFFDVEHEKI